MKVNEASKKLQDLIFEYFGINQNDPAEEENVMLISNNLLHNVRCELMQNYHYDSSEDKKLSMNIQQQINALGT